MVRIEFITSLISVLWSHDPSGDLSGDPFCTPLLAQEGSVPATSHGGNRCSREHYVLVQTLIFLFFTWNFRVGCTRFVNFLYKTDTALASVH